MGEETQPQGREPEKEVAHPADVTRWRGRSLARMVFEVLLIAAGVFLGLAGEQWRENAERREDALMSLQRFRTEITTNRDAVARVKDYHARLRTDIRAYLKADATERQTISLKIDGLQVVFFERTAWDLALTTGALASIDSDLAFDLSHAYNVQQAVIDLTRSFTQAMYGRPPDENADAFFSALVLYFDDVVAFEPILLDLYDNLLPQIDRALGE